MINVTLQIAKAILFAGTASVAGTTVKNATARGLKSGFKSISKMTIKELIK